MAQGGTQRGLTPEQWAEARADYESGMSVAAISKKFSIRRPTIDARRDRERWTVQASVHVHGPAEQRVLRERAQSNVFNIATKQAVRAAEESGVIQEIVDEILATSTASKLAANFMIDLLRKAQAGKIRPASSPGEQTEADVAKTVMSAYRTFNSTVRDNAGLRPGQSTLSANNDTSTKPKRLKLNVVTGPAA